MSTEPKKKPTRPSMEDLLNQIYEWRERATAELRLHDRLEAAKLRAGDLFENPP
jgi:hypothetical protein